MVNSPGAAVGDRDAGCSCRKRTVISRMSAFSSFEEWEVCSRSDKRDTPQ